MDMVIPLEPMVGMARAHEPGSFRVWIGLGLGRGILLLKQLVIQNKPVECCHGAADLHSS